MNLAALLAPTTLTEADLRTLRSPRFPLRAVLARRDTTDSPLRLGGASRPATVGARGQGGSLSPASAPRG